MRAIRESPLQNICFLTAVNRIFRFVGRVFVNETKKKTVTIAVIQIIYIKSFWGESSSFV